MKRHFISTFLMLTFPMLLNAQVSFLTKDEEPDASTFLPAPPDTSSIAFMVDFDRYQRAKSLRCTPRGRQASFDSFAQPDSILKGFAPAVGLVISEKALPETYRLLAMTIKDVRNGVSGMKSKYMRKRPFVQFHETPADPKEGEELRNTGSYPSGHSTRGWGVALVLTELFPDSANAILQRGYEYGESRVIGGYHYQSDVEAARLAASGVVARLHADEGFQKQMALARKELKRYVSKK